MILALMGPTGSGKSELALRLAKEIDGEILNGDAFQVYSSFPIATASPSLEDKKEVPHHLYNFVPSSVRYDIAAYQKDARDAIKDVLNRGKTPILVGGSGLYIRSALYDYDLSLDTSNVDMSRFENMCNEDLHGFLEKLDSVEASKIPYQNRRRLLRSIAICLALGESKTSFLSRQKHIPLFETKFYRLSLPREEVYSRIERRVERMFMEGIEKEVLSGIEGVSEVIGVYQAIGVKEFFPYRDGKASLSETKEAIVLDTKRFVKRQETFFRHQFDAKSVSGLEDILDDVRN